ncbi:MAG: hypothetical protein ACOYOB_13625 [Myxococcota bacterium]
MSKRLWMLVCAVGVLWAAQAFAQAENAPLPDRAAFAVRVVEATRAATPKMDPRLGDLERELRVFQKDYNSFVLVRDQTLILPVGGRGSLRLPDGAEFAIQLLGFTPGKVLRARHVVEMPRMKMTRAVAPGGRTLDVLPGQDRMTIVSTTVQRAP